MQQSFVAPHWRPLAASQKIYHHSRTGTSRAYLPSSTGPASRLKYSSVGGAWREGWRGPASTTSQTQNNSPNAPRDECMKAVFRLFQVIPSAGNAGFYSVYDGLR